MNWFTLYTIWLRLVCCFTIIVIITSVVHRFISIIISISSTCTTLIVITTKGLKGDVGMGF